MKNIKIEELLFDIDLKQSALLEINDTQVDQWLVGKFNDLLIKYPEDVFNKSLRVAIYKNKITNLKHQLTHIKNEI